MMQPLLYIRSYILPYNKPTSLNCNRVREEKEKAFELEKLTRRMAIAN